MFKGFTDGTLDFLIAIRFNNNREFFHDNHDWYMESVRKPLLELAGELSEVVEEIDPELEHRPERCVSRINRDLRFSKDKSPYRDWMWIGFHHPANKHGFPGFYMDISPDHLGYGLGFWEDNKPLAQAHRLMLQNHPEVFSAAIGKVPGGMTVEIRGYKKLAVPESVPEKLRPWYPLRSFYVYRNINDARGILDPQIGEVIKAEFRKLKPLYRYFAGLKPVEE